VVLARLYIRWHYLRRFDYADVLVLAGWTSGLIWTVLILVAVQLGAFNLTHTAHDAQVLTVPIQKLLYSSLFFIHLGLYLPKASLLVFYNDLIPKSYGIMRVAFKAVTAYLCAAMLCTFLLDLLYIRPISNNWFVKANEAKLTLQDYKSCNLDCLDILADVAFSLHNQPRWRLVR